MEGAFDKFTLRKSINKFPRVSLGFYPTPFQECPRLSAALGGPQIFIKRDDCTGLAFGGNKTRQLEFSFGEALAEGADCVIAGAAMQSNYCRQASAAAARLGLKCFLVLTSQEGKLGTIGNLLLDYILGAEVKVVDIPMGMQQEEEMRTLADELRRQGLHPYILQKRPTYELLSTIAYVEGSLELIEDIERKDLKVDYVYCAAAGATQAGLALVRKALGQDFKVVGIAPTADWEARYGCSLSTDIAAIATQAAKMLGLDLAIEPDEITNSEEYVGESYAKLTSEAVEAIHLLARTEGILLDPVYSGKAMAGLVDHIRKGKIKTGETVVFLHTGGTPALFAYNHELLPV